MFDPIETIEFTPDRRKRTRDALVHEIEQDLRRPRRKPNAWLIVIPSIVVAGAGITAGIALLAPVTQPNYVHCLARAELETDGTYPGVQVIVGSTPDGGAVPIEDAIAACTQVWQEGGLDPTDPDGQSGEPGTPPPPPDPALDGPVPAELTVCVMRDGSAGVVPGPRDVCLSLGLPNRLD